MQVKQNTTSLPPIRLYHKWHKPLSKVFLTLISLKFEDFAKINYIKIGMCNIVAVTEMCNEKRKSCYTMYNISYVASWK